MPIRPEAGDSEQSTRERILAAAAQLFRTDPNASMEAIASTAGLSRATAHRHFPAREALLRDLRARALSQLQNIFSSAADSRIPVVVRLFNVTTMLLAAKIDWSWALREFETKDDHLAENPVLEAATAWIDTLIRENYIDQAADPVWSAMVYLTIIKTATTALGPEDTIEQRSARAIDTFLHGLGITTIRYQRTTPQ